MKNGKKQRAINSVNNLLRYGILLQALRRIEGITVKEFDILERVLTALYVAAEKGSEARKQLSHASQT